MKQGAVGAMPLNDEKLPYRPKRFQRKTYNLWGVIREGKLAGALDVAHGNRPLNRARILG